MSSDPAGDGGGPGLQPSEEPTPQQAHRMMSRLWLGMLVWHVSLLGTALGFTAGGPLLDWPRAGLGLLVAASLLVLPGFGVAGYARMQSYKRYWQGPVVLPKGYVRGNLWVFGVLDLAVTLSALAVLCSADPRYAIPGVVAMTLEGINRPRMGPMEAGGTGGQGGAGGAGGAER